MTLSVVFMFPWLRSWLPRLATPSRSVEFHRSQQRWVCYPDPDNIPEQESAIFDVAFSSDGKWIATGDTFGFVALKRVGDEEVTHWMTENHFAAIRYVRFAGNDRFLVSQDIEGNAFVWSTETGARIQKLEAGGGIVAIEADPQGRLIVLSDQPALEILAEVEENQKLGRQRVIKLDRPHDLLSVGERATQLLLAHDHGWELRELADFSVTGTGDIETVVTSARMSPDGQRIALGLKAIHWLSFSPKGSQLAIASGRSSSLRLLDLASGELIFEQVDVGYPMNQVHWTEGGKTLVTISHRPGESGREGVLARWSGELIKATASPDVVGHCCVSPDGSRLATGGVTGVVSVYDNDLNRLDVLEAGGRGGIHSLRLMDNRRLFIGTFKGSLLLIDIETGKELSRFQPLPLKWGMPVRGIEVLPEKKLLIAVGGHDHRETMRIYSLEGVPEN